jgi:predicted TIM-barrel fold metal-dependent hydrolase
MMDLDALVAIDVHVHAEVSASGHPSLPAVLAEGAAAYFGADHRMPTVAEIAAYYRERRIAAVVFTVDAEAATGHPPISNEEIATACAEHTDVLIPFAIIDPAKGRPGAREAVDFPDLRIVMAHPAFPWQDEALSVATHKPNVYIDLSGWSPKYFPPQLIRYANTLLKDKVLFGSDYPLITPDRWLADFEQLDVKPDVRPRILKQNAIALLRLA